jgi:hypothetical protein
MACVRRQVPLDKTEQLPFVTYHPLALGLHAGPSQLSAADQHQCAERITDLVPKTQLIDY